MAGGAVTIQSNKGNGLFMRTNSTARIANAGNQITGNTGWGILCAGPPANPLLYGGFLGSVFGNKAGQIQCKTPP